MGVNCEKKYGRHKRQDTNGNTIVARILIFIEYAVVVVAVVASRADASKYNDGK